MNKRPPHHFHATVVRQRHGESLVSVGGRPAILGGTPPEFGGSDEVWSPEHLLVSSVALCFVATLEFFAGREQLELISLTCDGNGTVDKGATGLSFTAFELAVRLAVHPGEASRAAALAEKAKRACLVSASLKAPVELRLDVVEDARLPHHASPEPPALPT